MPQEPLIMRFQDKANAEKAMNHINPRTFESIELIQTKEGWAVKLISKQKATKVA